MEDFEKWLNEQKNSVAWSFLGEESRLYQAWVCGAMNQARLTEIADVLVTCAKCGKYHSVYIKCADDAAIAAKG